MRIGKVGSKGELFPPKNLRIIIGVKEGQTVLYRIVNGRFKNAVQSRISTKSHHHHQDNNHND